MINDSELQSMQSPKEIPILKAAVTTKVGNQQQGYSNEEIKTILIAARVRRFRKFCCSSLKLAWIAWGLDSRLVVRMVKRIITQHRVIIAKALINRKDI